MEDGVTEAVDVNEELYGNDRLLSVLSADFGTGDEACEKVCREVKRDLDAFVNLGTPEATPEDPQPKRRSATLIDDKLTHPADRWYSLALTASKDGLVSYVDGVEQCRSDLPWLPLVNEGFTSVGVRQNMVCWFKGDLLKIRVTPKVLKPSEFLQDHKRLNGD